MKLAFGFAQNRVPRCISITFLKECEAILEIDRIVVCHFIAFFFCGGKREHVMLCAARMQKKTRGRMSHRET
ncbi:unnamed protein product [Ectocarpus sp. CCAP 1310/34]|nr:unnamed protein product [Ectocarpus sp. CCAP 1310/34]